MFFLHLAVNVELSCRKGLTKKLCYPENTGEDKMFDSSISPSGLLERVVRRSL